MVNTYRLVYTKQAQKDAKRINSTGLKPKVLKLIKILEKVSKQSRMIKYVLSRLGLMTTIPVEVHI